MLHSAVCARYAERRKMKRARHQQGSVVFNKRSRTWHYLWRESGGRRSKLLGHESELPTKASAWNAAEPFRRTVNDPSKRADKVGITVKLLVEHYRTEKMPKRYSTHRVYESWLRNYILPMWGNSLLPEARPVELWLQSLDLAPRSKTSIRGLLSLLWDYAMWCGDVPRGRNPMQLVSITNASKRIRQPRSLSVEEFQRFIQMLNDPFHTIALVSVCFGLRVSECLALRWSDVDWLNSKLRIQRAIVRGHIDAVKTVYSERAMAVDTAVLDVLKQWKQTSQFQAPEDWIFASPACIGRLPWSADSINKAYAKAAKAAGTGNVSTHVMRHTYGVGWMQLVRK